MSGEGNGGKALEDGDETKVPEEGKQALGPEVLRSIGHVVLPFLITAGGLVGFVALAGGAVVWTRFSAAEVPPDQVVAIYPRTELVAIASALLLLFGLVGLIAFGLCYLIEPRGRASIGMTRVLISVMAIEGVAVIALIAPAASWQQRVLAVEVFVLALFACFCATSLYEEPRFRFREEDLKEVRKGFFRVSLVTFAILLALSLCTVPFRGTDAKVGVVALFLCAFPVLWLAWTLRNKKPIRRECRRKLEPFEVPYTRDGMAAIIFSTVLAIALPAAILRSWWLALSLFVAALLFAALWRAALMPKEHFRWYGIAVFVSVPLFGTLTWMAQNVVEPQVQPMAMIRKTGGIDEYLEGIYVTETSDRVYFATVATKGCGKSLVSGSGRLLSVPKSEIAAMAVGPLQSVDHARRAALEMTYALAPSAGVRAGGEENGVRSVGTHAARRLENVPGAIEPQFGRGMRLVPEVASPGQQVTLRISAPSESTHGFGRSRHHRTLRVDGVVAPITRERARSPWETEYVKTRNGRLLKVGKQIAYAYSDGSYHAVSRHDDTEGDPLFLRISDKSVITIWVYSASDHAYRPTNNTYLPLRWMKRHPVELMREEGHLPMVTLRNQETGKRTVLLTSLLLRQNWHEDHIKFRLPKGVRSGRVTIDCGQIADEPYLQIREAPERTTSAISGSH